MCVALVTGVLAGSSEASIRAPARPRTLALALRVCRFQEDVAEGFVVACVEEGE